MVANEGLVKSRVHLNQVTQDWQLHEGNPSSQILGQG